MRFLILILLLASNAKCISQTPNPDLFQTWYLQDMFIQFGPPLDLMEPPVYATLTISENLEFNGQGSCNTFNGTYLYNSTEDRMESIDFERTFEDCIFPYHNSFESEYFEDVRGPWFYTISNDGVGLTLEIYDLFELSATYTNYPLSTNSMERVEISMYPNPVTDILSIASPNNDILSITLFSSEGKKIKSIEKPNQELTEISLLTLNPGLYFVKIYTDTGIITKKILKK